MKKTMKRRTRSVDDSKIQTVGVIGGGLMGSGSPRSQPEPGSTRS